MVITWVCLAHGWKGAGYEMDGGRSGQVSIDVINTFDISAHDLVWLEVIHLSPVMSLSGNKMAQLLNAGKPSWTCSKEKESFCNCWSSLGLCIPLIATSVTFSCVGGSKSKFEGSSPCPLMTSGQRWKTSMRQYWANTSAQKQQPSRSGARHFCLQMAAIWSTFWHLCRLEISQYYVDFYTVSKIGPC